VAKGPLTRIATPSYLSPQGEVKLGKAVPHRHLSLGGKVAAKRRVRGPLDPFCAE